MKMDIIQRRNDENNRGSAMANNNRDKLSFETRTDLQNFYTGQNIFITGATGFMGKILIEKLLRSCPDIENIYILCRPKKGKDVHTRIEEIFDDAVFSQLRTEVPKFRHKIVAMPGDCAMPGLGLTLTDRQTLINNVNIVFHAAATVRFDEKLKLAIGINVHGTRDVLGICHQMTRLKSLIHVSTAYANCHLRRIEEKFYDYPVKFNELDAKIDQLDDKTIDNMTSKLIGNWPNTYTYTKALAEDMVRRHSAGIPVGVFRPAIVTSTAKEPLVGWIDNLYGPTGVVAGAGTGVLRTMHCDKAINANIVPVDFCVNALIAAAWDVYHHYKELQCLGARIPLNDDNNNSITTETTVLPGQGAGEATPAMAEENKIVYDYGGEPGSHIPIYNYVSSVENPLTWGQFTELNVKLGFDYPFSSAIWYHCFYTHKSAALNFIFTVLLHYLPALLIDGLSICVGQKPRLLKVYKKIHKMANIVAFFCNHEWIFTNDHTQKLWQKLSKTDQAIYNFNMKDMDWASYFHYYIRGMRIYLFKDDLSTLDSARKKWNRFYYAHQTVKMIMLGTVVYFLLKAFAPYMC